jgi:hypothetical protein
MTDQASHRRRSRQTRVAGPAPGLTLAACAAFGCDHLDCHRAQRAHERLTPPVSAAGSRRRLRALAWNGFSPAELAERLDEPERVVRNLLHGEPDQVPSALAARIATLYDDLWDHRGPSARTAEAARRHHFAPALAWDDDEPGSVWDVGHSIDDPGAVPAPGWQRRPERAWGSDSERVAELGELVSKGMSLNQAAKRLCLSGNTLTRIRHLVAVAS